MDELHKISELLIERETIDKDQFERLLAGEAPETVFVEEEPRAPEAEPEKKPERKPQPQPRPFPLAGRDDAASAARRRQGITPAVNAPAACAAGCF